MNTMGRESDFILNLAEGFMYKIIIYFYPGLYWV